MTLVAKFSCFFTRQMVQLPVSGVSFSVSGVFLLAPFMGLTTSRETQIGMKLMTQGNLRVCNT